MTHASSHADPTSQHQPPTRPAPGGADPTAERVAAAGRKLSPRRKTTQATTVHDLAVEQLEHYHLDPDSPIGRRLVHLCERLYEAQYDVEELWEFALRELGSLPRTDRIAWFNALKFLAFQIAKVLDTLSNPLRRSFQELRYGRSSLLARGHYPPIDNITAIFSANTVITRTATYIYACAEWVDDAFRGRESTHGIYQRLLNPTAIALANHIVDIEAGPRAGEYMAWNFNSGMAAIDAILSHLVGYEDVILSSRNIYGGSHQLIVDWFARPGNLNVGVEWFDGTTAEEFAARLAEVKAAHADRLARGRSIYVYLESPCNPHGYVLDVAGICRLAHEAGLRVIVDGTVGTPFLVRPLQREDPAERPDFVVHSYTKDMCGTGTAIAGVVIGRNEDMFLPKGESAGSISWDQTLFWNVYYVKGAFLDADKAFEVLNGLKTLELRMLTKCIGATVLARFLAAHPGIRVKCNGVESNRNHALMKEHNFLGLPAPLFTIDFEDAGIGRPAFQSFFDSLAPTFGHMVSLGQSNTVVLCPALTSHSELSPDAMRSAGIAPTTMRISVGDEEPRELIAHFMEAARSTIEPSHPGFCAGFMAPEEVDRMARAVYLDVQTRYIDSRPKLADALA